MGGLIVSETSYLETRSTDQYLLDSCTYKPAEIWTTLIKELISRG